ncbi:putative 2OG-Fe(II) oxygenase [Novosphingobium sp. B 225]|uniref:putative 2OG-Fe(II) oxygenase n=1 Tax=Novosphingobium sp. B 225 TaxID=1961849 RepID=UPI000B4A97FD|nr:putative 2OG-Fe(II) oxygenase [Novosphingobium sp. B 225]
MTPEQTELEQSLAAELSLALRGPDPQARGRQLALARKALPLGLAAKAIALLSVMARTEPGDGELALLHGVALRQAQRLTDALEVFTAARAAGAQDPALVQGIAQTRYELGLPAASLFAEAQRLQPANRDLLRLRAAALATEGEPAQAEAMLEAELARRPGWLEGHKALSVLRWTTGDQARHADSYAAAVAAEPDNPGLWLAWFHALAQTRDWPATLAVLGRAQAVLGDSQALRVARLFVDSESGDLAATEAGLAACAAFQGQTLDLIRVRHFLRQRRLQDAESICLAQLLTPSAPVFWPYLSLVWRMAEDARWHWIDRPEQFIKPIRIDLSPAELSDLSELLRSLHVMDRPYVEQSVRGGTQTDRSVIQRHEPLIRLAKARWLDGLREYVAGLPPHEQGHPLLGLPRGELLVEGSWSVRLQSQGYNVPHNHPVGWISTAFYVALPDAASMGPPPAGHIAFGTPPEELGLDLPAYATIAPEPGLCAVFPATMWHRTMPFDDGERLVLALDLKRPRW